MYNEVVQSAARSGQLEGQPGGRRRVTSGLCWKAEKGEAEKKKQEKVDWWVSDAANRKLTLAKAEQETSSSGSLHPVV